MKKIVKICLLSASLMLAFIVCLCGTYFTINYVKFSSTPLNVDALSENSLSIGVYGSDNEIILEDNTFNTPYVKIEDVPAVTKQAFLSIEDKNFYSHNGINKKRIVKAMLNNVKSLSLKEGASTISQQLIKNTHLSSEKTFERKIKEFVLTQKLEKDFSKDEILESYLNVIYFGNNCYGLESASNFYFNKSAKDLSLADSALLAGMIKSPNRYSPIVNAPLAKKRRNLVLSEMQKDGKITEEECVNASESEICLNLCEKHQNKLNSYSQMAIDEAVKILKMPAKQIALSGLSLHTYQDKTLQKNLEDAIKKVDFKNADSAGLVVDNESLGVSAFVGNGAVKILDARRQVGSCIKPILVYAPALNENVITTETQILDEKIKIGDYSPSNAGNKYQGYISVEDAVKNSSNVVAIKVLSYIGIDKGKNYASKLGFTFDEADTSYALALGGMTYGENLKTLTESYTVFPNSGKFDGAKFIKYITDSHGNLVYEHKKNLKQVFREDSAFLMTKMLKETAISGTAKRLSAVSNTEIASKTGTVGVKDGKTNLDAYNISYTPELTIGVWCGTLDGHGVSINGGNEPTEVVKNFVQSVEFEKTTFDTTSQVTDAEIDLIEKEENHRLMLANSATPDRYKKTVTFSRFNMPSAISQNFVSLPETCATCVKQGENACVSLDAQKYVEYEIFLNSKLFQTIKNKSEKISVSLPLKEENNVITIKAHYAGSDKNANELTFNISNKNAWLKQEETPKKSQKKWYI